MEYIKLTSENIDHEHICCAIADKKHQEGVICKKEWLKSQFAHHHTFYKLNENGKVFIEYVDAEGAWTPIVAPNYLYIHCFWVSGSFKGKGHAKQLLNHCIEDAMARGKSGICVLAGNKKAPYLSDKSYLQKVGFAVADKIGDYELLSYRINDKSELPKFADNARKGAIETQGWVVYHSAQCPFINNCLKEMAKVATERGIAFKIITVNSILQAQEMPCVFNNFAVFYNGRFVAHMLFNGNSFEKLIDKTMTTKEAQNGI